MICKDFENWILTKDVFSKKDTPGDDHYRTHLANCPSCARLYDIDQAMENMIKSTFQPVDLPDGLYDRIDMTIDQIREHKQQEKT